MLRNLNKLSEVEERMREKEFDTKHDKQHVIVTKSFNLYSLDQFLRTWSLLSAYSQTISIPTP